MAEIPLHNRAGEVVAHALIDDDDFDWLDQWPWYREPDPSGYAARNVLLPDGRRRLLRMQRLILGLQLGDPRQADHRDRDRLNNQRSNLRIVPGHWANRQNMSARKGRRGANWDKRRKKWVAQVQLHGKVHNLGRYATEEQAAEVAEAYRREHMEFAVD